MTKQPKTTEGKGIKTAIFVGMDYGFDGDDYVDSLRYALLSLSRPKKTWYSSIPVLRVWIGWIKRLLNFNHPTHH